MVITIASMKGGVGKTTIAAMMARYISDKRGSTVVVIDLDPQRGATIILLGARKGASISPPTIYDILQSELANMPSTEIFAQTMRKSPYSDKIFLVPANGDLARILEEDTPPDLLRYALDESPLSKDVAVIVDTGSGHKLCEMSVAASDVVFIPLTLSQQSGIPTMNTMRVALDHGTKIGGIIPLMIGEANWEKDQLEGWRRMLLESTALREMNVDVLQGMPYSRLVIRGRWRWGKIPRTVLPALDEIYLKLFGKDLSGADVFLYETGDPRSRDHDSVALSKVVVIVPTLNPGSSIVRELTGSYAHFCCDSAGLRVVVGNIAGLYLPPDNRCISLPEIKIIFSFGRSRSYACTTIQLLIRCVEDLFSNLLSCQ